MVSEWTIRHPGVPAEAGGMMATPRGTAMEQQGSIPEKLARFSEL